MTKTSRRMVDVFLRYVKAEGVEVVFGIPGGLLHPLFRAIEQDPALRLIVAKHEEGAAFMADGFARASGRLAMCCGCSGPGATNLLTGVSCAFADGVPMLVVTGQPAIQAQGKGAMQETPREDMDIVAMFRPVCKYSTMVTSPESVAHHLRRALRLALTGRPGPVHINVPIDLWDQATTEDWFDPSTYRPLTTTFDRSAVQRAVDELLLAEHPTFLVGSGVATAKAADHLRALAEMLPAQVATTPRGKGLFPEDHGLSLGVLGNAGHRAARDVLLGGEVDVLFTIGASLNEVTTYNWLPELRPSKALLQNDIDADRVGRNYPVDVPLVGDAQTILVEIVYHVHRAIRDGKTPHSTWQQRESPLLDESHYAEPALRKSDAIPVSPQRWRADLTSVLPDDAIVFSDIGGHMFSNVHDLCIRDRQKFIVNLGMASMGHGTVAPIGAALACPGRPIFAIVGDACFAMNGMELLTAVEYAIPVIWIVENNNMHGLVWYGSKIVDGGGTMDAVRFKRPMEIAAIARAMGLTTWVVDAPGKIQDAVRDALALHGPALIEVRVDASIPPPLGDRARAIAGFVKR